MEQTLDIKANKVKETVGKHVLADGFDFVMDIEKSHGSWLYDKLTDREYLGYVLYVCISIHRVQSPLSCRKIRMAGKNGCNKPTLADVYSEEYAHFLEVFERVVIPEELQYAFFIEGGTLGVENAMKACFDWKTRKNFAKGLETEAGICIHFKQAFHGRSGYTLSLTNTSDPRKYQYFPMFNWPRILNPKLNSRSQKKTLKKPSKTKTWLYFRLKRLF
jgi:L-lysine 6-transaminase